MSSPDPIAEEGGYNVGVPPRQQDGFRRTPEGYAMWRHNTVAPQRQLR